MENRVSEDFQFLVSGSRNDRKRTALVRVPISLLESFRFSGGSMFLHVIIVASRNMKWSSRQISDAREETTYDWHLKTNGGPLFVQDCYYDLYVCILNNTGLCVNTHSWPSTSATQWLFFFKGGTSQLLEVNIVNCITCVFCSHVSTRIGYFLIVKMHQSEHFKCHSRWVLFSQNTRTGT